MSHEKPLNGVLLLGGHYAALPSDLSAAGWRVDIDNSYRSPGGFNQFITFVNDNDHQVVIAFKGSDCLSNYISDLSDSGYSAYQSVRSAAVEKLNTIQNSQEYEGYEVMTDGHSLGGGMAQTFAFEQSLNGYGQNSLPISPDALDEYCELNNISPDTALAEYRNLHTF